MFWTLLHVAGYVALATLLPPVVVREKLKHSDKRRTRSAAARIERIARLELQLGIGLDFGREWLLSRPVTGFKDCMADLVKQGNGAVERKCWGCKKTYRPHDEYNAWYHQTPDERALADRLCGTCYAGAVDPTVADIAGASEGCEQPLKEEQNVSAEQVAAPSYERRTV